MPARLEAMIASVQGRTGQMLARFLGGLRYGTSALGKRRPRLANPMAPDSGTAEYALPESYGDSRVVALVIDPHHLHVYWELTAQDRLDAKERLKPAEPEQALTWVLRFHDITGVALDSGNAHAYFDVVVNPGARNWYVELWSANKAYFVELGACAEDRFVAVCRSQPIQVPPAAPSVPQAPELAPERAATRHSSLDAQRFCEPLSAQAQRIEVASESALLRGVMTPVAALPPTRSMALGQSARESTRSATIAPEQCLRHGKGTSPASGISSGSGSAWQPPK